MTGAVSKFLVLLLTAFSSFAVTEIKVITYYNYSPWIELNSSFAQLLNENLKSKYKFVASYVPRKRVDQLLGTDEKILVPFTSPKFFDDFEKTKYSWSSTIFTDHSYYISKISSPFIYKDESSYSGKKFSGILGHNYADLDDAIKSKKLEIEYAPSTVAAVTKVFTNKRNLDFSVIDTSTLNGMERLGSLIKGQYILSNRPGYSRLERMVLVSHGTRLYKEELLRAIDVIGKSKKWLKIISNYQELSGIRP
ncbi:hypothetical protein [Bacteriovorax sp. Seq25_V]|uniref:hypothetical protein n=1 Tax=Bacteriovorax sp. Seq25_V TaxID=1201288 RepID=UPI00038A3800|nr:hypothetical protein [Bacteriovorax sp. Seq25_V]EQC47607.1 hypothetical protein M900_0525 [Bacteriovorax sp. Seq25_V]